MYVAGPSLDTANHSPPGVENNSPATGRDIADSQIDPCSNALAADVVTEAPTVTVENPYTQEQLAVIEEIAEEASSMFSVGVTFQSFGELRDAVRKFAHKKGFSITSFGNRFSCSRCAEAACYRAKRLKRQQQTAPDNRRKEKHHQSRLQLPGLDHPPEGDDDLSMRYCVFGDEDVSGDEEEVSDGEEACSFAREEASRREDPATSQEVHAVSRADTVPYRVAQSGKYNLRELYQIFQDLAHCINKVRDPTTKDLLVGTALKLKDVAVGNVEQVYSQPILDTLHSYLHLFGRTMAPQDMFAQASRGISHLAVDEDGENQYEPGAAATLKNSKPPGANGGRRYRSRNERTIDMMKEARKREALCSLCLKPGHRVVTCPKISEAKATLIGSDNLAEFTDGLGDPMFCVVEEPCGSVRETIKEWMQPGRNIPVEAVHVVVQKCFYSATRQDSSRNVVEVFIWGEGGTPVGEHCPSYYPVNKVAQWILTNCTARMRKKHILSCLQKPVQGLSQHLYNYGTSP
ncbi:hypothetical protein IV203_036562 [Nitzschia inconspicua]|uniref:Uncharacterized protein n=1 Tax=Nitzschia inconspicua TaxID=303405 RepID=A0A9K3LI93_9STRA|nr:hypothetical protein IV203_036562 [Nitzschia inconspicua]